MSRYFHTRAEQAAARGKEFLKADNLESAKECLAEAERWKEKAIQAEGGQIGASVHESRAPKGVPLDIETKDTREGNEPYDEVKESDNGLQEPNVPDDIVGKTQNGLGGIGSLVKSGESRVGLPVLGVTRNEVVGAAMDELPQMACTTCTLAEDCPEFRDGYLCAYNDLFKGSFCAECG